MEDDIDVFRIARGLYSSATDEMVFIDNFECEKSIQWLSAIGKTNEYIEDLWGVPPMPPVDFLRWCKIASLLASLHGINAFYVSRLIEFHSSVRLQPEMPDSLTESLNRADFEISRLRIAVELLLEDESDQAFSHFELTPLQKSILNELDGKKLTTSKLADACHVEPRRLYKKGGLNELKNNGYVKNHRGYGYYRPDRPPKA
ncbi:hypothetical protein [Rubinisphaera sp.]|uniref:hypothetical protein n=1 Tax=Rubinisphaera sp. TaxID=2024857 RepID=UPI000C0F8A14|nr:hypothetical protein [Rubinisphaera sp.]MBV09504.1 hypothetical protein [Rubinisphaera sp.]HCS50352.1 hypothetical protein [Planctomycetaceae bacterium]|tara:strand:- start:1035 stop:1640 length:606 start_codon:yes stop_codon:yes gene_type:complete